MLEYVGKSYKSEEEWDMTDSSLSESAPLEEEIQVQTNSIMVIEKEDVE